MSRSRPHLRGSARGSSPHRSARRRRASVRKERGSALRAEDRWGDKRFVIIASQFNPSITRALIRGATATLVRHGLSGRRVRIVWGPGTFELPVIAVRIARSRPRPDAIIALGALIRGQTPQYEVLAHAAAQGLSQVSITTGIPVTFGIVVAENVAQAKARAGGSMGNRGAEAALAAISVLRLFNQLQRRPGRGRSP